MSSSQAVVDAFHKAYYESGPSTWMNTFWGGVRVLKCPLDLWIYQEIFCQTSPDVLIETGTYDGGSALYFATVFDMLGRGRVISIDIEARPNRPVHPRISYITGSSVSPETIRSVASLLGSQDRVMAVLDSDHSFGHVSKELEAYSGFVSPGAYLIVEDTNVNGNPVLPEFGPGPNEAVASFLLSHPGEFERDHSRERFGLTFCPGGYLKRRG